MTKQLLVIGTAVMTTLLALVIVWQFRIVILFLLVSLMLAAAVRPLFTRLVGRSLGVRAAWILLFLAALTGFGFVVFAAGDTAVREIQQMADGVSEQDEWRLPAWMDGSSFQQSLAALLPSPGEIFEAITGDEGQLVLPAVLGFTRNIASLVSGFIIILILSIYWSANQSHFELLWLSLLPSAQRSQARDIWRTLERDTGAYIRGQLVQSLLAGLVLGAGYWLLGSPYPALLALVGALASLVPVIGAVFVVIPVLLIGLLTSVQLSIFTTLYAVAFLIVLGVWVKPRLFSSRWNSPLLTLVLLIALADAFGLAGIIAAPIVSVVLQILWSRLVSGRTAPEAAVQFSDLQERQERLWETIRSMEEPPMKLVTSSMKRLDDLIEKAEPIVQATRPNMPADLSPIDPEPES